MSIQAIGSHTASPQPAKGHEAGGTGSSTEAATTVTTVNADGSTTTVTTNADGSTSTTTTPAPARLGGTTSLLDGTNSDQFATLLSAQEQAMNQG